MHNLHDFFEGVTHDLLVEETNDSSHLKDEVAFPLLTEVLSHVITMVDVIIKFFRLNVILHGANIRQQGSNRRPSMGLPLLLSPNNV